MSQKSPVFTNVTFNGRSYPRLAKDLTEIGKKYSDMTYNEQCARIEIPSLKLSITLPHTFPWKSPFFETHGVTYVVPKFKALTRIAPLIPTFHATKNTKFVVYTQCVTVSLHFLTNGKMRYIDNVFIDTCNMTIKDFVNGQLRNYFDTSTSNVYTVSTQQNIIYSAIFDCDNKKLCDMDLNNRILTVSTYYMLSIDDLVDYMVSSVTLNLSDKKIVSTPNSGQAPGIIRIHLTAYKDDLDAILKRVFKMTGVMAKYGSFINMVVFYLETHLNIFSAELRKTIKEFEDVENLPDLLLTKLSEILIPSNEPYFSIMLALFGNISGEAPHPIMPIGYTPDDRVMKAYKEYENICSQ